MRPVTVIDDLRSTVEKLEDENFELKDRLQRINDQVEAWVVAGMSIGLTRTQARLLGFIATRKRATRIAVLAFLYDREEPCGKILDTMICKIRQKLPTGVEIHTVWGIGWEMTDEGIAILKQRMGVANGQAA